MDNKYYNHIPLSSKQHSIKRTMVKSSVLLILFILSFLNPVTLLSQEITASSDELKLTFNVTNIENGLYDNDIKQIIQDKKGFVWLATGHGLSRLDGVKVHNYNHDLNEPESISSNALTSIHEDSQGRIWVGTIKGLNLLNNQQDGFSSFYSTGTADSLSDEHIRTITEDNSGNLWIGTNRGINRLQKREGYHFMRYLQKDDVQKTDIRVNFLLPIKSTVLAGTNQGIFIYDLQADRFIPFDAATSFKSNAITAYIDSRNTLWISVEDGVYFKQVQSPEFVLLDHNSPFDNKPDNVISINEDINGNIWLGSESKGLFIYYPDIHKIKSVKSGTHIRADSQGYISIQTILRDQSGMMWMGTNDSGILKWNPKSVFIQHFNDEQLIKTTEINNSFIWHFKEHPNGDIWLATTEGTKVFDPDKGDIRSVSIKAKDEEKEPVVYTIALEGEHLWFATPGALIRYTPGVGITNRITAKPESELRLPENAFIYSAEYIDGILYVALENSDLVAIDLKTRRLEFIPVKGEGPDPLETKTIINLKKAMNNSLWILSNQGLFNYSPEHKRIRLAIGEGKGKLSNHYVSALYEESPTSIWLGTSGNGINHLEVKNYDKGIYEIKQFDNIDRLKYQIVNGLVSDNAQSSNLWITTHRGLYYFNTLTNKVRKFSMDDGIQGQEFNEGAYLKDSKGYLYFGGVNGFNRIDPFMIVSSDYKPPVNITSISATCMTDRLLCNKPINVNDYNFNCAVDDCRNKKSEILRFPSDLEKLYLSFVSLDFTNPANNVYRYRIYSKNNKDRSWINLYNENQLTFTKLKSNQYTLEIQGSNHAGIWSDQIASIAISVAPPWYLTKLSKLVAVLIMLSTIYLFISNRNYRRKQQKKIQQAIDKSEENFKFVLWGSGDEMWEWKANSDRLERTNPMEGAWDLKDDSYTRLVDVVPAMHPDDREKAQKAFFDHLKGKTPYFESLFRARKKDGSYIWIISRGRVVERDESNRAVRVLGSNKDINLIKKTEDKLKLIGKAFENTMEGISILDPDFKSVFNNKAFYQITGLSLTEGINKQFFFSEQSENHGSYQQIRIALRNFGEWEGEIWEKRPDGKKFALELKIDKVLDDEGNLTNYICIFSDITYRKNADEKLRKLANFDTLTGLPNRALFIDRLTHALAFAKRHQTKFALMFIDLDHFKNINDSLGHSSGDELLKKVANRLKRCIRDVDTIARLGGDEFVIILENIHTANDVGICANKIIRKMQKAINITGASLKISPSIGIGIYPEDGKDIETLLKNSDLAMYSAKEIGRNNYQFFRSDMTSSAIERINLENKVREAIDNKQLELYYQPKVYAESGKVTGFEALIRWNHPEDGLISPAHFIPIAEETGLILAMGDWILEESIKQAKAWSEINPNCCSVAVNISARQFQQDDLPKNIQNMLDKYQLDSKYIELEITESTLMNDMEHAISTLHILKQMGISLALDDFGTGYSSLSYLKKFPVNKLKVDQSFVRDITTDQSDASIVASIISLAHNLNLEVVAEGCETVEHLNFICSYQCEQVQGHLFSRAVPNTEAEKILKNGVITLE